MARWGILVRRAHRGFAQHATRSYGNLLWCIDSLSVLQALLMFTLQTLANLAEILGGAAVVGGVIFAVWQIRQYREQRRDVAAIEIVRSLQSREFIEAFRLLSQVPDGVSVLDTLLDAEEKETLKYMLR